MFKLPLGFVILFNLGLNLMAYAEDGLPVFTDKDMHQLSEKISRSLLKCKELRSRPDVIVEIENRTDDIIDKTKFSELIHSKIEGKSHRLPDAEQSQFEIRAKLEAEKKPIHKISKSIYTLTAQVFQAEEKLCEKRAVISKTIESRPKSEPTGN